EARTLAAEDLLHAGAAVRGAVAKEVNVLAHFVDSVAARRVQAPAGPNTRNRRTGDGQAGESRGGPPAGGFARGQKSKVQSGRQFRRQHLRLSTFNPRPPAKSGHY